MALRQWRRFTAAAAVVLGQRAEEGIVPQLAPPGLRAVLVLFLGASQPKQCQLTRLAPVEKRACSCLSPRSPCPPECNCNAIRLSPADVPVRDVDGVIYANLCLARCQHADIDTTPVSGAAGGGAAPYNPRLIDAQAALGPADLTRYSAEGFRLVAKIKMQAGKAWTPRLARRAAGGMAGAAGAKLHAARITDTGLLYLQPRSAAGTAGGPVAGAVGAAPGPQFAPGFHGSLPDPAGNATGAPAGRQQASRKLLQPVGTDERWQVTSPTAHAYPWRAVGYIASGCSGSLIGPSTVLTAGHCVYDTTKRTFFKDLRFTPDMHDGGRHCSRRRGRACLAWDTPAAVPWATVTTWFNNAGPAQQCDDGTLRCQSLQDFAWDLALITLKRDAGNQFGWLGYGYTCRTKRYAVTSAGYPSDLDPTMTRMYATSGTLNPFSGCLAKNDVAGVVSSDLDTAPGQSGSPIWENTPKGQYIRATHNAGGPYHRTIVKEYFDWIMQNRK